MGLELNEEARPAIPTAMAPGIINNKPGNVINKAISKEKPKTSIAPKKVPTVNGKENLNIKAKITAPIAHPEPKWYSIPIYPMIICARPIPSISITPNPPARNANMFFIIK